MRRFWIGVGIVLAMTMPCARASADPCLTARPLPQCRACFVTEFGYDFKITSPLLRRSISSIDDSVTSIYENPVSGGALLWGAEGESFKQPGFIGSASWNLSSWQSVDLTITSRETTPWEYSYVDSLGGVGVRYRTASPRQREVAVYLGHTLASKPGLVVNGAALLTTGVVIGIFLALLSDSN